MTKRQEPADIDIIATGGNFENQRSNNGIPAGKGAAISQIEELIVQALGPAAAIRTLFLKNSSGLTQNDRSAISEAVEFAPSSRVVIVHGTSTMDETARFLCSKHLSKTIVLTGTTVGFLTRPAEAFFNLGAAISLVQALPFGVYAAMNGRIIPPMSLRKDSETGRFDIASGEYLVYLRDRR